MVSSRRKFSEEMMERVMGLEPTASTLARSRSSQLSYTRSVKSEAHFYSFIRALVNALWWIFADPLRGWWPLQVVVLLGGLAKSKWRLGLGVAAARLP